jgi:DNA ligase-1
MKIKFENWCEGMDPEGLLLSEKLDGVFAEWTGKRFVSKEGNEFAVPEWFRAAMPAKPCRGELWGGRGNFAKTVGIVRSKAGVEAWRGIQFVVWDDAKAALHTVCRGVDHLKAELSRVESLGGEGLILWSLTTGIRFKIKTMHDAEATVISPAKGKGIRLRLANGIEFGAGIGADFRAKIGAVVTFRYLRLSPSCVPISANVWRKYYGQ